MKSKVAHASDSDSRLRLAFDWIIAEAQKHPVDIGLQMIKAKIAWP
jgi:hypothetical protein